MSKGCDDLRGFILCLCVFASVFLITCVAWDRQHRVSWLLLILVNDTSHPSVFWIPWIFLSYSSPKSDFSYAVVTVMKAADILSIYVHTKWNNNNRKRSSWLALDRSLRWKDTAPEKSLVLDLLGMVTATRQWGDLWNNYLSQVFSF